MKFPTLRQWAKTARETLHDIERIETEEIWEHEAPLGIQKLRSIIGPNYAITVQNVRSKESRFYVRMRVEDIIFSASIQYETEEPSVMMFVEVKGQGWLSFNTMSELGLILEKHGHYQGRDSRLFG